jgi:hypothetical protein
MLMLEGILLMFSSDFLAVTIMVSRARSSILALFCVDFVGDAVSASAAQHHPETRIVANKYTAMFGRAPALK